MADDSRTLHCRILIHPPQPYAAVQSVDARMVRGEYSMKARRANWRLVPSASAYDIRI